MSEHLDMAQRKMKLIKIPNYRYPERNYYESGAEAQRDADLDKYRARLKQEADWLKKWYDGDFDERIPSQDMFVLGAHIASLIKEAEGD